MKKIVLTIMTLFLISYTRVEAASYNISASKTSATVGENVTVTVTVTAGAWNLHINGAVSGDLVGYDEDSNVTKTKTFTLSPSSAGTYTVTLTGDITDYDTEVKTDGINKSVTVTFTNPAPQPDPEPEKPSEPEPVQPSQPQNNNYNNNSNTNQTETKKEEKQEEKKEEEIKKEEKKVEKEKLKISKFYVVGYDINFRQDKLDYTIDIDDSLKAIYIVVDGENLEISGDKEVNIVGKNRVVVRLKSGNTIEEYTIRLNRKEKEEEKKENNLTPIFIGTTVLFALTTIGLGTYIIIKKKRTV